MATLSRSTQGKVASEGTGEDNNGILLQHVFLVVHANHCPIDNFLFSHRKSAWWPDQVATRLTSQLAFGPCSTLTSVQTAPSSTILYFCAHSKEPWTNNTFATRVSGSFIIKSIDWLKGNKWEHFRPIAYRKTCIIDLEQARQVSIKSNIAKLTALGWISSQDSSFWPNHYYTHARVCINQCTHHLIFISNRQETFETCTKSTLQSQLRY